MSKNMIFPITQQHYRNKKLKKIKKGSNFCQITPLNQVRVAYFKTPLEITIRWISEVPS